jgi:hypothetical protein
MIRTLRKPQAFACGFLVYRLSGKVKIVFYFNIITYFYFVYQLSIFKSVFYIVSKIPFMLFTQIYLLPISKAYSVR